MSNQQEQTQEQTSQYPERYRITDHITRSTWLHIEDATDIGKLRLFAGKYQRGEGAKVTLAHWLDVSNARVLFHDLSWGKAVDFTEFKGSAEGQVTSRVLRVNTNGDKVYFELRSGPGKRTETGAIQPAGKPTDTVNVAFTKPQVRAVAYAVLEYLQAIAVAQVLSQNDAPAPPIRPVNGANGQAGPPDPPDQVADQPDQETQQVNVDEINDILF